MVSIHLICVGKLKEKFYIGAAEEYVKRLSASCKFSLTELPEQLVPDRPSAAQIALALSKDAERITAAIPKSAVIIALCVEGVLLSSEELAQKLSRWTVDGSSSIAFLIGGSYGLHESVKNRANLCLSMSPMTFPHHLARVMALEQLYRAFQILDGTRYHK